MGLLRLTQEYQLMDFCRDWQTGCILNFHKIFDIEIHLGIRKAEQTKGGEDIPHRGEWKEDGSMFD